MLLTPSGQKKVRIMGSDGNILPSDDIVIVRPSIVTTVTLPDCTLIPNKDILIAHGSGNNSIGINRFSSGQVIGSDNEDYPLRLVKLNASLHLISNGTYWDILNDGRKQITAQMVLTANQTMPTLSTFTKVTFNSIVWEDYSGMCSTTNNRITFPRRGKWLVTATATAISLTAATGEFVIGIGKNGAAPSYNGDGGVPDSSGSAHGSVSLLVDVTAITDYVEIFYYNSSVNTAAIYYPLTSFMVQEIR